MTVKIDVLLKWFKESFFKVKRDIREILFTLVQDKNNSLKIGDISITNSKCEKFFGGHLSVMSAKTD